MNDKITIETLVKAPLEKTWSAYTSPEAIVRWNAASDDWHTTHAENDLRAGGAFLSRMEAKDGSEGFDFTGTYDEVVENERIAYTMDDGRHAEVVFSPEEEGTKVTVSFDPESQNPREFQEEGWTAILESFRRYTEAS